MTIKIINGEEAYQRMLARIGRKKPPTEGPTIVLSPSASQRLYDAHRKEERFKAQSIERAAKSRARF